MMPALHIAHDGGGVDLEAACRAAADFLSALGVAIDTEDLRDTPARMARAHAELFDACMTLRGIRAHGAKTVTSALLGTLRADRRSRAEFFALAGVPH